MAKRQSEPAYRDLPPGQREISFFPRFGLFQYASRIELDPSPLQLEIGGEVKNQLQLDAASFDGIPSVEQTSDLHCVTTWSKRDLQWSGYRFSDFYERVILPQAQPAKDACFVALYARDGYRTHFMLEDILATDVLLADRLEGRQLSWEHGAPLRLVAPAHYGFRSAKHLHRIEFCRTLERHHSPAPAMRWIEHPRARVAHEERGCYLPPWIYRYTFRALIPLVLWWYRRADARAAVRPSFAIDDPGAVPRREGRG